MKLFVFACLCIMSSSLIFAQKKSNVIWFNIAGKGGFGNSIFLHKEVMNDPNVKPSLVSPSYFLGGRLGASINDVTNISFEASKSSFGQEYELTVNSTSTTTEKYTKEIGLESFDLALMFRGTAFTGFYGEIGPKISFIKKYSVHNSITANFNDLTQEDYSDQIASIVAGLGIAVVRSQDAQFELNIGLRGTYSFDKLLKNITYTSLQDGYYDYDYYDNYRTHYKTNNDNPKTSLLMLQLVFELNYYFGFYGRARCGKTKFILFKDKGR